MANVIEVPGTRPGSAAAGHNVILRNGSTVLIRQVQPADAPLLADGFARLSDRSRRMRFLYRKDSLSAAELRYLTDIDHHDHEALGVLDHLGGAASASPATSATPPTRRPPRSPSPSPTAGRAGGWAPNCSPGCPRAPAPRASAGSPRWWQRTTRRWRACSARCARTVWAAMAAPRITRSRWRSPPARLRWRPASRAAHPGRHEVARIAGRGLRQRPRRNARPESPPRSAGSMPGRRRSRPARRSPGTGT